MNYKESYLEIENDLPLFFQSKWIETTSNSKNWDVALVIENDNIIAAWPFLKEQKFSFQLIRNPLLTPYLGPIFISNNTTLSLQEVYQKLKQQLPDSSFYQWSSLPNQYHQWDDTSIISQQRITHIIDLRTEPDELWKNIQSRKRSYIKNAHKLLQINEEPIDWSIFIKNHQNSFYKKSKKYNYTKSLFERIESNFKESSLSIQTKDAQGFIQAQAFFVYDKHAMYYLLGAYTHQAHQGAMASLIWYAVLKAKQMNLHTFDFEGSMDNGIATFFKSIGGVPQNYYYYEQTNSFLWQLINKLKHIISK